MAPAALEQREGSGLAVVDPRLLQPERISSDKRSIPRSKYCERPGVDSS
jgi:hypothetical protein